jgi:hypothetical protein
MAKEPNWDSINEDKRRQIQLGQSINLVIDKYTKEELFNAKEDDLLKEINTVYHLILEAETRILKGVPLAISDFNKEVGTKPKKLELL